MPFVFVFVLCEAALTSTTCKEFLLGIVASSQSIPSRFRFKFLLLNS